jgi:hypothetical protein
MPTDNLPGIKTRKPTVTHRALHQALQQIKPSKPEPNWLQRFFNAIARKWLFKSGHGS